MNEKSMNNFEEYDDPILYDMEYASYSGDIPLLKKWASKNNGIIIDLACGTGRATIPLALEGHKLIGVDLHKEMLNRAKKKATYQCLNVEWVDQDCTKLRLNIYSPMIYMVGNGFQHFLTNDAQNKLLASVHRHLETDGIFIFDTRFPNNEELLQSSLEEEYWRSYTTSNSEIVTDVYTISNYNLLTQIQNCTTIRRSKRDDGKVIKEKRTHIRLRYSYPKEIERMLSERGFEILNVFRDWEENPLTNDCIGMVYVCRKNRTGKV